MVHRRPFALSQEARVRIAALLETAEPRWKRRGGGRSNAELIGGRLPDAFELVAQRMRLQRGVDVCAAPMSCRSLDDTAGKLSTAKLLQVLGLFSQALPELLRARSPDVEGFTQSEFERQLGHILVEAGAPFRLAAGEWSPAPISASDELPGVTPLVAADDSFGRFLRAALHIDRGLPLGPSAAVELSDVAKLAKLSTEDAGRCLSRMLAEGLGKESEVVADGFALDQRAIEFALAELRRGSSTTRETTEPDPATDARRAVVLTALALEYSAVRAHLSDLVEHPHPSGAVYEIGRFGNGPSAWQVLIAITDTGNVRSAQETERAVAHFRPHVALFVGVAGGRKDVEKGDVIAADKVYGYESGKDTADGFRPRPDAPETSYAIRKRAQVEALRPHWHGGLRQDGDRAPSAFVGPIASGEKLVASSGSAVAELLGKDYGDALAVEMEGHGFLRALASHNDVQGLLVRGVSDLIDDKQAQSDRKWQPIAAANAAAFAFHVLGVFRPVSAASAGPMRDQAAPSPEGPTPKPDAFLPSSIAQPHSEQHYAWQFELESLAGSIDLTKTEMHAALLGAVVVQDIRDHGRTARWPRLLRLPNPDHDTLPDGLQRWRLRYDREHDSEAGEEHLALGEHGRLIFQRDTLCDGEMIVDMGLLAFDLVVHAGLGVRLLSRLGAVGGFRLTARLRVSSPRGAAAKFSHGFQEERAGAAWLRKPELAGTTHFPPDALSAKPLFVETCKRSLDRVANEFALEPRFAGSGPPFLAVSLESIASVLERMEI